MTINNLEKAKFQLSVYKRFEPIIEELKDQGLLEPLEVLLARDLLYDLTLNNSELTEENNLAIDYFEDPKDLLDRLKEAHKQIKKDYGDFLDRPNICLADYSMTWTIDYVEY